MENRCSSLRRLRWTESLPAISGQYVHPSLTSSVRDPLREWSAPLGGAYLVFTKTFDQRRDWTVLFARESFLIDLRNVINSQSSFASRYICILTTQLDLQDARIPHVFEHSLELATALN